VADSCIMDADVDSLSVKELKELINKAGLSIDDCVDKSDLLARAREARTALSAVGSGDTPPTPSEQQTSSPSGSRSMAGYECVVNGPSDLLNESTGKPADLLFIGLHGLGASSTDLADLPKSLSTFEPSLASLRIVGVFPQAPQTTIGAAWWKIDVQRMMMASFQGDQNAMAQLIREKPEGLDACRAAMRELIKQARALAGGSMGPLPTNRIILAGFSLGAITSLDLALQQDPTEQVGGVVFMNGAPICVDVWAQQLATRKGLRAHLSCGLKDMVLPPQTCGWVRDLLQGNGAVVEFKSHQGAHEIGGADILRSIAKFVATTAQITTG